MREIFRREIRREKFAQNALLYTTVGTSNQLSRRSSYTATKFSRKFFVWRCCGFSLSSFN